MIVIPMCGKINWVITKTSLGDTVGRLFLRTINFENGKIEEAIFTNLHWCLLFSLQLCHNRISANFR